MIIQGICLETLYETYYRNAIVLPYMPFVASDRVRSLNLNAIPAVSQVHESGTNRGLRGDSGREIDYLV